jgi:hypothetical protein
MQLERGSSTVNPTRLKTMPIRKSPIRLVWRGEAIFTDGHQIPRDARSPERDPQ